MLQLRGVDGERSEEKLSPVFERGDLYRYRSYLALTHRAVRLYHVLATTLFIGYP